MSVWVEACLYMSVMQEEEEEEEEEEEGVLTSVLWKLKQSRASSPCWRQLVTAACVSSHQDTWDHVSL